MSSSEHRSFRLQIQELAKVTGLTTDLVRYWFATRAPAARPEQVSALKPAAAEPPPPPGSAPVEPHPRGSNEKIEQSLCGQAGEGDTRNTTQGSLCVLKSALKCNGALMVFPSGLTHDRSGLTNVIGTGLETAPPPPRWVDVTLAAPCEMDTNI